MRVGACKCPSVYLMTLADEKKHPYLYNSFYIPTDYKLNFGDQNNVKISINHFDDLYPGNDPLCEAYPWSRQWIYIYVKRLTENEDILILKILELYLTPMIFIMWARDKVNHENFLNKKNDVMRVIVTSYPPEE